MGTRSTGSVADSRVVELNLDAIPLALLRAEVRRLSGHRDGIGVEDAVQVTDELASNACRHGLPPRICRLRLVGQTTRLRVEIEDNSLVDPQPRPADHTGGLGLVLIDQLAESWGVSHRDGQKTVWAEVELTPPPDRLSA